MVLRGYVGVLLNGYKQGITSSYSTFARVSREFQQKWIGEDKGKTLM